MKVKLFRRGRLVGLVNQNFHQQDKTITSWEELGISTIT